MSQTRDTRRDQVVEAALKLIGERGMSALTTAALAKEVGMSEANIYRHFRNKEEIVSETVRRIGDGLGRNIEKVKKSNLPPIKRLKKAFQLHLKYVGQNRGIPRLLFSDEINPDNPDIKQNLLETISGYAASLEDIVEEGKKNGSIKQYIDAKATALTFIGMIQVSTIRWILSDFKLFIEDEGLVLWNNYEPGITTQSSK